MNITQATKKACEQETLVEALSWICVWESERIVKQAKRFFETGIRTGARDAGWDTCFGICIQSVLDHWPNRPDPNQGHSQR